jgi:hypothetical protein
VRQPWERQTEAGEGEEPFACFAVYRDLGPLRRSITLVARECDRQRALVGRWSSRWSWVERAGAWDAFVDQQRVDEQVEAVREMAKRHAQASDYMLAALLQRMQTLVSTQEVDKIPVAVMPRWLDVAVRVGRLSRGASTEILAPEGPVAMEAGGRTLAQLFEPARDGEGLSELEVARALVERSGADRVEPVLDAELAEILAEGEDPDDDDDGSGGDDDPAELRPAAEVPDPEVDEVAQAWQWLRGHQRRPPAGDELVRWLDARRLVGLDPDPTNGRPGPRRRRRRAS